MLIDVRKNVLLTGAGFTRNFGGFLARDMWARIFNSEEVQSQERVRKMLVEYSDDYETAYEETLRSSIYTDEEKNAFQFAVEKAYEKLDDTIRDLWAVKGLDYHSLGPFLRLFFGDGKQGVFFTLNQDLFMERNGGFRAPGLLWFPEEFYSLRQDKFKKEYFVTLPKSDRAREQFEKGLMDHNGLHYIKLHGSYGWHSSQGTNQMVIGNDKEEKIGREPLLKVYFDFFKDVIWGGGVKMVVIGYGFRDRHINEVLTRGIEKHGLKLYVVMPKSFQEFKIPLYDSRYEAEGIIDGIRGYY